MEEIKQREASLSDKQKQLLEIMKREQEKKSRQTKIEAGEDKQNIYREEGYPLSPSQERVWFQDQMNLNSASMNISAGFRLLGDLQVELLEKAIEQIIHRHVMLRISFRKKGSSIKQFVQEKSTFKLDVHDFQELDPTQKNIQVEEYASRYGSSRITLGQDSPYRITLLKLNQQEHIFIIVMHHIISDFWSNTIFMKELTYFYTAYVNGEDAVLPAVPLQYTDYAVQQQKGAQCDTWEAAGNYWKEKLKPEIPIVDIPTDRPRTAHARDIRGKTYRFEIPDELVEGLRELGKANDMTLFIIMLSAYKVLLHGYTGLQDIIVGTPVANRLNVDSEGTIGFFANNLAIRSCLQPSMSFEDLLQEVKQVVTEAYDNQSFPFDQLFEIVHVERSPYHQPLIQTAFALIENVELAELPNLRVEPFEIYSGDAKLDILFNITLAKNGSFGVVEYNSDLYEEVTVVLLAENWKIILDSIWSKSAETLNDLLVPTLLSHKSRSHEHSEAVLLNQTNLTKSQLQMWMGQKISPDIPFYNMVHTFSMKWEVDVPVFQKAFQILIKKTDALRLKLVEDRGIPQQIILADLNMEVPYFDWSGSSDPALKMKQWLRDRCSSRQPAIDRLFETAIFKLGESHYEWYINQHHLIIDKWSLAIMTKRQLDIYDILIEGKSVTSLPEYPKFQDYIDYEQEYRQSGRGRQADEFWAEYLKDSLEPVRYYGKSGIKYSHNIHQVRHYMGKERSERLDQLAAQQKIFFVNQNLTIFTIYCTVIFIYLYRMTGNQKLSIGTPFQSRFNQKFKETVGCFMEPSTLRVTIEKGETFSEVYENVRAQVLQTMREYPYATSNANNRSYDVMFNYHPHITYSDRLEATLHPFALGMDSLNIQLDNRSMEEGYALCFDFHQDVFDSEMEQHTWQHILNVADQFIQRSEGAVDSFCILSPDEETRVIQLGTGSSGITPTPAFIHQDIEIRAEQTPDQIALIEGKNHITYRSLNERANYLAHLLKEQGAGKGTRVAVCCPRSAELVIAIIAVLKTGACYVPIDPVLMKNKLNSMLYEAEISLVVTNDEEISSLVILPVIMIPADSAPVPAKLKQNLALQSSWDDLMYIIFTSGSTGRPKCAGVTHQNYQVLLSWYIHYFELTSLDRVFLVSSPGFDLTQKNIFAPLVVGGTLCIYKEAHYDPGLMREQMHEHKVTIVNCTPSTIYPVIEHARGNLADLDSIRWLVLGGESINPARLRDLVQTSGSSIKICNTYGPTECADVSLYYQLTTEDLLSTESVPLGVPLPQVSILIVNEQMQLCPTGVQGEICIAGSTVGAGYLNDQQKTQEKFIPHPYTENRRLYRTGDCGRLTSSGRVEYLGRMDDQIKLRGYRIELGEIEHALLQHPSIREAVVLLSGSGEAGQLVAYITLNPNTETLTMAELRSFLCSRLADYMIPSSYFIVEQFPMSVNGKISRKEVSSLDCIRLNDEVMHLSLQPEELIVRDIWSQLLLVDSSQLGVHQNFFEQGGHSLAVARMISLITQVTGTELAIRDIFDNPTIAGIAALLQQRDGGVEPFPTIIRMEKGTYPLSYAQQRLWYIDEFQMGSMEYNITGVIQIEGRLDYTAVKKSLDVLVKKHEVLRTAIQNNEGFPVQVIESGRTVNIIRTDFTSIDPGLKFQTVSEAITVEASTTFDLTKDELLRVNIFELGNETFKLVMTIHHIIADGLSVEILLRDFTESYNSFIRGEDYQFTKLPVQYVDYVLWQKERIDRIKDQQLDYWKRQLQGAPFELPGVRSKGYTPLSNSGQSAHFKLSLQESGALQIFSRERQTTMYVTLLSIYSLLLARLTGGSEITVGTPVSGRTRPELNDLIGLFVNTVVLRLGLDREMTFEDLVRNVKKVTEEALENSDIPFEMLVKELRPERVDHQAILFQSFFVYQELPSLPLEMENATVMYENIDFKMIHHNLKLSLVMHEEGLEGVFQYRANAVDSETVASLTEQYRYLVSRVLQQSRVPVSELFEQLDVIRKNRLEKQYEQFMLEGRSLLKQIHNHQSGKR